MTAPRPFRRSLECGTPEPSDRASMLIEFGITVPMLMALLFGSVQFGLVLYKASVVSLAASEAVYQLAVCQPADYANCVTRAETAANQALRWGGFSAGDYSLHPGGQITAPGTQTFSILDVKHSFLIPFLPGITQHTFDLAHIASMRVEEQP